jgi:hypothetical protein
MKGGRALDSAARTPIAAVVAPDAGIAGSGGALARTAPHHDRQSGHRVIEVSSAESPFGLKTISFLDLSLMYAVLDV